MKSRHTLQVPRPGTEDADPLSARAQGARRRALRTLAGLLPFGAGLGVPRAAAGFARQDDPADAARRALLVGNARYPGAELRNPVHDARLVATSARAVGFHTRVAENADRSTLVAAFDDFVRDAGSAAIRLFYFAGHGVRYQGVHYLLPAGVRIEREDQLPVQALDTDSIVDRLATLPDGVNLLIFDACRAPFALPAHHARGLGAPREGLRDLVARRAPRGTLIVYSTGPQQLASDGPEQANGPFARHLAAEMLQFGIPVEQMLKRVRMAVMAETQNRQIPWEASSLAGDLYLASEADWGNRHAGGRP